MGVKGLNGWHRGLSCDVPARVIAVLAPGEAVAELRVCKLVQAPLGRHAKVSPHVLHAAEVELLYSAATGLETLATAEVGLRLEWFQA